MASCGLGEDITASISSFSDLLFLLGEEVECPIAGAKNYFALFATAALGLNVTSLTTWGTRKLARTVRTAIPRHNDSEEDPYWDELMEK